VLTQTDINITIALCQQHNGDKFMPLLQDNDQYLKLCGATVLYDAITRPDTNQDGKLKYSIRVAVAPENPDLSLLQQLVERELASSKWRGVMPAGGKHPLSVIGNDYGGNLMGWTRFSAGTYNLPDIYSETGSLMDPMQYGNLLFGGQRVDLLVHCFEYDNRQKGIGIGLDAAAIIVSANAPRQNFGGSGIDTSAVFGGGAAPQQQYQQQPQQYQQQPQQPQQPQQQYQQQQYMPPQQQYMPPQQQYMPPQQGGSPMYQPGLPPAHEPQQQQQQQQYAPQQAHQYLPQ
jgi:hypothetical protein